MFSRCESRLFDHVIVILCCVIIGCSCHREHKVHNIVLYPDKHSWCNATPIKQVVGQPGCEQVEVKNSVCVGGCFSYSIPRTEPHAPGEVAPYCDSCQPSATSWKHVTLKCTSGEYEGELMTKRVEIIEGCSCRSCGRHSSEPGSGHDLPHHQADTPQLMDLVHTAGNASLRHKENHLHLDSQTNHKLLLLLKRFSEKEEKGSLDKESVDTIVSDINTEDRLSSSDFNEQMLQQLPDKDDEDDSKQHTVSDVMRLRHMLGRADSRHRHPHHTKGDLKEAESETVEDGETREDLPHRATLDVESHHLKPANPGAELAYRGSHQQVASGHHQWYPSSTSPHSTS